MARRLVLGALVAVIVVAAVAGVFLWVTRERAPERSATAFCTELAATNGLDGALVTLDPTRLGPLVSALERASKVAPPDIAAQVATLSTFVGEVTDAVRAEPTDKKKALADALAQRQERIDEVTAAGRAVEDWSLTNCGTTLRSTTTTTSRSTTTVTR